jgi:hypothetical protein
MSSSVQYSEFCNQNPLDLTGVHWLVVFGDVNSLLHENQNTVIVDPSGDVCLKEMQNNHCVVICFILITVTQEKVIMSCVSKPMSQDCPGYSPPPIQQKSSYQCGSKSEQVPRYPLLCRNPRNAVINKKHATMSNA